MKYDPEIHHRRSIRLKGYDYSQSGFYYITLCCQDREHFFGEIIDDEMVLNDAGKMVEKWFHELENKFTDIRCDEMVVMPNHCHFIVNNIGGKTVGADLCVCPYSDSPTVETTVGPLGEHVGSPQRPVPGEPSGGPLGASLGEHVGSPLRSVVQWFKTMTTNEYIRGVKNIGWRRFNGKLWQRNYWEHVVRNEKSLENIRNYIINNPAKWAVGADLCVCPFLDLGDRKNMGEHAGSPQRSPQRSPQQRTVKKYGK